MQKLSQQIKDAMVPLIEMEGTSNAQIIGYGLQAGLEIYEQLLSGGWSPILEQDTGIPNPMIYGKYVIVAEALREA